MTPERVVLICKGYITEILVNLSQEALLERRIALVKSFQGTGPTGEAFIDSMIGLLKSDDKMNVMAQLAEFVSGEGIDGWQPMEIGRKHP